MPYAAKCRLAQTLCGSKNSVRYRAGTAPTVVRDGNFRLFFFSREETQIHVHVEHPDGEAKYRLTPQVALATYTGLSKRQLREAQSVIEEHLTEIQNALNHHLGG